MPGLKQSSQITVNADNSTLPILYRYEDFVGTDAETYVTGSLNGAATPTGTWADCACQRPNNNEATRVSSPQGYSDGEVRFTKNLSGSSVDEHLTWDWNPVAAVDT